MIPEPILKLTLHNRQQAWADIQKVVFPFLGQWLAQGKRFELTIQPVKRSNKQNARYWGKGVLSQIAEQVAKGGKKYPAEIWHEYFKREFLGVSELPNGQVIGQSSTGLTQSQFSEFCAKVEAHAAAVLGVTFYDLPNE